MALEFTASYMQDALSLMHYYKSLADRAIAQVDPSQLHASLDAESNSMAVTMKHVAGNLRSRWTDFLTTDGEKPDRDRDNEFVDSHDTAALMQAWEEGWQRLFGTLESLSDKDLGRQVTIRGEAHSVLQAINRALGHCAYHCGQIVMLAKHWRCEDGWKPLTIPRGKSGEFNQKVQAKEVSQR